METLKRSAIFRFGLILGAAILIAVMAQPAVAADQIKIRCGWTFPQAHPFGIAHQIWAKKIEKDSNGRIKMEHFWNGSLVSMRDSHTEVIHGVADVTEFTGNYVREGFQIEKAMSLLFYGVPLNSEKAYRIYAKLCDKYPEILKEFAATKVLAFFSPPTTDLLTRNKPVRSQADFKGLTLKTSGAQAKFITALGGEGAAVPLGETYMSLQKGTIDGALTSYEALKSFRLAEVTKYFTILNMSIWPSGHVEMNLDKWNSLPKDIQKIFDDNTPYYNKVMAEQLEKARLAGKEAGKKAGIEFIELPKAELDKVYKIAEEIVFEEAKRIDAMGLPGTQIARDARKFIDEYAD